MGASEATDCKGDERRREERGRGGKRTKGKENGVGGWYWEQEKLPNVLLLQMPLPSQAAFSHFPSLPLFCSSPTQGPFGGTVASESLSSDSRDSEIMNQGNGRVTRRCAF